VVAEAQHVIKEWELVLVLEVFFLLLLLLLQKLLTQYLSVAEAQDHLALMVLEQTEDLPQPLV
jgi:hypothetical protein